MSVSKRSLYIYKFRMEFQQGKERVMSMMVLAFLIAGFLIAGPALAAEQPASCAATDPACLLGVLEQTTTAVAEDQWRDNTYREIAKLYARQKQGNNALDLIGKIKNPDTKAMTIRGIGMAAAKTDMTKTEFDGLFAKLAEAAAKIDHPPSHAIALTYISMAQAYARDNEGAMKTAAAMENTALRNKAYGEAGEVQATRGEIDAVMTSINAIDDPGYRDKELRIISKVFTDGKYFDHALKTAEEIKDAYQKSQAILYLLVKQVAPEEVSIE